MSIMGFSFKWFIFKHTEFNDTIGEIVELAYKMRVVINLNIFFLNFKKDSH